MRSLLTRECTRPRSTFHRRSGRWRGRQCPRTGATGSGLLTNVRVNAEGLRTCSSSLPPIVTSTPRTGAPTPSSAARERAVINLGSGDLRLTVDVTYREADCLTPRPQFAGTGAAPAKEKASRTCARPAWWRVKQPKPTHREASGQVAAAVADNSSVVHPAEAANRRPRALGAA